MADGVRILLAGGEAQIEEKKSRFIATIAPVTSEAEANDFLAATRKRYWDARHNCSAFVVGTGAELTRCSDDGEPSGTAGRPMLETLLSGGVRNAAVCVTRYFGGVLLGTGGLVRAYTRAVQEGLAVCTFGRPYRGVRLSVEADYNDYGRIQHLLAQRGIAPERSEFGVGVELSLIAPLEGWADPDGQSGSAGSIGKDALVRELLDVTAGRARICEGEAEEFVERISSK